MGLSISSSQRTSFVRREASIDERRALDLLTMSLLADGSLREVGIFLQPLFKTVSFDRADATPRLPRTTVGKSLPSPCQHDLLNSLLGFRLICALGVGMPGVIKIRGYGEVGKDQGDRVRVFPTSIGVNNRVLASSFLHNSNAKEVTNQEPLLTNSQGGKISKEGQARQLYFTLIPYCDLRPMHLASKVHKSVLACGWPWDEDQHPGAFVTLESLRGGYLSKLK